MFKRFAILLIAVFVALCFAAPVAAQEDWPRLYLENPVDCAAPQTEPLPLQTVYEFSDSMDGGINEWTWVDGDTWDETVIIYACPPPAWTPTTVVISSYQYSYGSYRNEHFLRLARGSYITTLWNATWGGGCTPGFTNQVEDATWLIGRPEDPPGGAYEIRYFNRAMTKTTGCSGHVEHEMSISFEGYEVNPSPHCTDGIEVLEAGPVYMPSYSAWEATLVTGTIPFERSWVTYVYSDPTNDMSQLWVSGEFNDAQLHQRYSGYAVTRTLSVPNHTDPYHQDPFGGGYTYDPYGFVSVPPANLRFSTVSEVYLMSACIRESPRPLTTSDLCPDGLEVLTEPLNAGDFSGTVWEDVVAITTTHVALRYVLQNPYYPIERLGGGILVDPEINGRDFLVEGTWRGRDTVTFTLPTTGAIYLPSENVSMGFSNEGPHVKVLSICVLDALETLPQLREGECHLLNPDFVQGLGGWSKSGNVTWDSDSGNGAATMDGGGGIWQVPIQDTGTVWRMEVRARAVGAVSGTLQAGSTTDNIIAGGPQLYDFTLTSSWLTYAEDVFIEEQSERLPGGLVQLRGDNAQVDFVCLTTPGDALPVAECYEPTWNPSGSGDPLYTYLFKYLAEWGMYIGCLIVRVISIAYNGIIRVLDNILLRIPNFDPNDGILGVADWLNAVVFRMLDWIGASFADFFQWLGTVFQGFAYFIQEIVMGFVMWLAGLLGFDPFFMLQDLDALWDETLLFWDEIQSEIGLEVGDLLLLVQNLGNVMIVLVNGVREGVSGEAIAYIGTDFEGVGAFIWEGVDFLNEAIESTPLSALNIIGLAVIAITLSQWTLKKFGETLEFLGR